MEGTGPILPGSTTQSLPLATIQPFSGGSLMQERKPKEEKPKQAGAEGAANLNFLKASLSVLW